MRKKARSELEALEGIGARPPWADKPALKEIWDTLDDHVSAGWSTVIKAAWITRIQALQPTVTNNELRALLNAFLEAIIARGS